MRITLLPVLLLLVSQVFSQQNPCTAPENKQFDFWLGDWKLTWNDTLKGTNSIKRVLGECIVEENFSDPKSGFSGKSWSVYNPNSKKWQQTWVDNQGGYIVLTGGMQDGKMILQTAPVNANNKTIVSRMVFYNIKPDSFEWDWERSEDNGSTWKLIWRIHYSKQ